jgi:eukaryotic-like serine/threonine-protein kinase
VTEPDGFEDVRGSNLRRQAPAASERRIRNSLIGRVLAERWTITHELGAGGTATVYAADHRNGCQVAVKVLHPELAFHPVVRRRFLLEGYAANRAGHPNAVRVLDDGEDADGTVFIVMDLLRGQSFASRLRERGALPVAEVVSAMISVLDVLATAHDNGIVHRDIKPANIFLTDTSQVKLLDFGIAKITEKVGSSAITEPGLTVGTPEFMAPEQAAGRYHEVDALTDLWAVGATMVQLLTYRFVHDVSSSNGLLFLAATRPVPGVLSLAPDLSPAIARVIDRALAFNRSDRWPNARAMRRALLLAHRGESDSIATDAPSLDTSPEGVRPELGAHATTGDSVKRRALGLVALLLLMLGPLRWWFTSSPPASAPAAAASAQARPATAMTAQRVPMTDDDGPTAPAASSAAVALPVPLPLPRPIARRSKRAEPPPPALREPTPGNAEELLLDRRK